MRHLWAIAFVLSALLNIHASGQQPQPTIGMGAFISLGLESSHSPSNTSTVSNALAGVYADWLKPRVHPGLDLRAEGGTLGVRGLLVGPRASIDLFSPQLHPYVEALFGPNRAESDENPVILPGSSPYASERTGITCQGVIGIDGDLTQHFSWRVVEFTQSNFSGIPTSHPHAISTGIVFHL